MPESPALKEYNKPEENILSTKKTPEEIRKMIESNGIDVADIIELKKIRDKMKTAFTNLKNEIQKPEKPENPPEVPGKPTIPETPVISSPGATPGTGEFPEAPDGGWIGHGGDIPTPGPIVINPDPT